MSAYICNDYHISLLAAYTVNKHLSCVNGLDAEQVGRILHWENVASVNYRYNKTGNTAFKFDDRANITNPSPVVLLKAAKCLNYQSCEHKGWEKSYARKIIEAIISNAIYSLPGYQEAQWEIDAPICNAS